MSGSRTPAPRALSELEGVILGLLAGGPFTAYAVRQFFLRSPSPYWSGSAGAIYPLVLRLQKRGLVTATAVATGRRQAATYRLTPAGRAALRTWLRTDADASIVGVPFDALRSRMRFLHVLDARERRTLVAATLVRAREHLAEIDRDAAAKREAGDRAAYHVARGAQLMMRARVTWLDELLAEISAGRPARRSAP